MLAKEQIIWKQTRAFENFLAVFSKPYITAKNPFQTIDQVWPEVLNFRAVCQ